MSSLDYLLEDPLSIGFDSDTCLGSLVVLENTSWSPAG
jgi:hypothetical protein